MQNQPSTLNAYADTSSHFQTLRTYCTIFQLGELNQKPTLETLKVHYDNCSEAQKNVLWDAYWTKINTAIRSPSIYGIYGAPYADLQLAKLFAPGREIIIQALIKHNLNTV